MRGYAAHQAVGVPTSRRASNWEEVTQPNLYLDLAVFPRPGAQAPGSEVTQPTRGWCSHLPSRRQRVGGYAAHPTASGKLTPMISRFPPPEAQAPGGVTQPTGRMVFPATPAKRAEVTQPIRRSLPVFFPALFPSPRCAAPGGGLRSPPGRWCFQPLPQSGRRLRSPSEPGQCSHPPVRRHRGEVTQPARRSVVPTLNAQTPSGGYAARPGAAASVHRFPRFPKTVQKAL